MNKKELVNQVTEEMGQTKKFTTEFVDTVFEKIGKSLEKGEDVQIFGFGKFKVSKRAAYDGRNPQTGEAIKIPARNVVGFKPAKALKERVK